MPGEGMAVVRGQESVGCGVGMARSSTDGEGQRKARRDPRPDSQGPLGSVRRRKKDMGDAC